ncbi:hypothetical protein NONI108955_21000 [Nocardia ninae]|uniref:Uncharacterized protein n=1 Tax=Nocardia ninae NBRC 108245 TaxID=1210091 RepID=A0A511M9U1_9NOCA|nr:hypothetical protein [Nocardia ninae]GEM37432.1 hypothetical protein NN4_19510 [Nocardia ninae NBRC 108245]
MEDIEYYEMIDRVCEDLARNAKYGYDINIDFLNRGGLETQRRLKAARDEVDTEATEVIG